MDESGHITDTTGQTYGFLGSSFKPQNATNYLGVKYGDGGGGSGYTFTGNNASSMFNYFKNGGFMSGLSFGDTDVTWYTGTPTLTAYSGIDIFGEIDLGIIHKAKIANYNPIDYGVLVDKGFNWIQNHPREFTSFVGTVEGSSQLASWGLKKWDATSNISKSRIFAETISTKLPISAKALGVTSKGLNVLGKAVGVVGLVNTGYQWSQGNISDARAIADGVMGVVGFLGPWGAGASLVYFGGMALIEHYGNNDKPLF
jgi:hypothetical protein